MSRLKRIAALPALCALALTTMVGCETMNNTEKGAVVGGAGGAGLGAIIGNQVGHKGAGALIGGATGALFGGAVGKAKDNAEDRDMYAEHAAQMHATREFERNAMNNYDIIKLSQNGMSDRIIVNEIKRRGGQFDMSTDGLIRLRDGGVSEHVVESMQQRAAY